MVASCLGCLATLFRHARRGKHGGRAPAPNTQHAASKQATLSSSEDETSEDVTSPSSPATRVTTSTAPTRTGTTPTRTTTTTTTTTTTRGTSLRDRIPRGSWDSHMHVLDPSTYPLSPHALYAPPRPYRLPEALAFQASLGLDRTVFVQPSIYGDDNRCLLDALREAGPGRAAAVVAFEPDAVPASTLREWHALGVRAVRVNLASVGRDATGPELERQLLAYADVCAPLGWSVQVYLPMRMLELLEPVAPKLAAAGVRLCIDHMGHPSLDEAVAAAAASSPGCYDRIDPYRMRGFASLVALLRQGNTFVKLSAPYRFLGREDPEGSVGRLEPVVRELLRVAGTTRLVFATDWPHTRFDGLDIRSWVEAVLDWCDGDDGLVERVFRGNADDLWADRAAR